MSNPVRPKPWWRRHTAFTIIVMVVTINVGVNTYNGEKDPGVNILDNSIQITGKYGFDVYFSDITGISLIGLINQRFFSSSLVILYTD